jgi:hypothetical protein
MVLLPNACPDRRGRGGAVFLVFPAEVTALLDVRKIARSIQLGDALFEAVAFGINCLVRCRLTEHAAKIDEMLLSRLPLGAIGTAPTFR